MTTKELKRMTSQGRRLREARLAAGYRSGREAATANGWAVSTYSAHEAGRRKMGEDDAEKYARRFKALNSNITAKWILWGDGGGDVPEFDPVEKNSFGLKFVPVRGVAKAGTWIEVDDSMQTDFDPVPFVPTSYKGAEQIAYKISGQSMDRQGILDGDYVICVPYFLARSAPTTGDVVIVERRDGQMTELSCKRLIVAGESYELHPNSSDARFKPIIVPAWNGKETDAVQVEIVGLVIGKYTPF